MNRHRQERKQRMAEFVRKDILDNAIAVLLEQGIEKFTMDRVAAQAGMAKGTVYLYYKNKPDLLDAVLDYGYLPLQDALKQIIQSDSPLFEKLAACIRICLQHTEENMDLMRQLGPVLFATVDARISDKASWYWTIARMLGRELEAGAAAGLVRPVNYVKVSALFLDAIDSLMIHRIFSHVEETVDQDVEALLALYLNGLKA